MSSLSFSLKPFPSLCEVADFKITCQIARSCNSLSICYSLSGPLDKIVIPLLADRPARKSGLWEETCFEFFLRAGNSDQYWEFNLSPAGHWNVYHFKSYRKGMQEEIAFSTLPCSILKQSDMLRLTMELDLSTIVPADLALKAAISAVIEFTDHTKNYWALIHPRPHADFHCPDSFIANL